MPLCQEQDGEIEVHVAALAAFTSEPQYISDRIGDKTISSKGVRTPPNEAQEEIVALTEHKKGLSKELKKLHVTLSDSVLHEHKCQQRVEKQQMLIDYHRSRAEAVNGQIQKLSKELKTQERAAWDSHQAQRLRREARAQKRTIQPRREESRRDEIPAAAGGKTPPLERSLASTSKSDDRSKSTTTLSRTADCPQADGPPCALPPEQDLTATTQVAARTSSGSVVSTTSLKKLEQSDQTLLLPPCPSNDNTQKICPFAEAEEDVALSRVVHATVSMPDIQCHNSNSAKSPSFFWKKPTNAENLAKPSASSFPKGTTLLDWFKESEKSWEVGDRTMSADSATSLPLCGKDSKAGKQRKSSEKRAKKGSQGIEMTKEMTQREQDHQIYKWLDREMKMLHRQNKFAAMEEKHALNRRRVEVCYACVEVAGSARAVFDALDQNQSGQVSMNEFDGGIRALGVKWQEITGFKKMRDLFRLFDTQRKGHVTFIDLFPYDAQKEVDPMRLSTPEFFDYWCKQNRDCSPNAVRSPTWEPNGPEEELANIARSRKYKEDADAKKTKMRVMMHNLKHNGKSDARCREIVALHLPRGSGPNTMDGIQTFCENDVQACRKAYTDEWQETVRNIEKTVGVMHDQRSSLHKTKQQLWHTTKEPMERAARLEEQKSLFSGGGMSLFKKSHHEEVE